ncbi:MAG: Holliday junction ATP-dependent DNA helicase RuvA [Microgenomates group bacterium GW2011_GWC1_46_16]|uniref:Holliday junction branch migration complex subunit RuvA n=2 Tax=Candidatus Collieribacteriota TaxID=1752725 RepID=A0A1F5FZ18_9BACT|nr:MAG: Holliday junction ATP-dependent DNA helicase RuvA [Microgenomates group bacterium GW2011_GWF1_46_12]KKU26000.1 MAG: Holliday junction ATP-dependent DNA helicase RuvA [Microgenomates group bacterium GW2011_GWC1_46_16]KKU28189.1 MAG: Holliday junction ATP-dependent DNA helicase RuvA [Microgenomates group bacterium GW2011_GWF2_46_18]KKU43883.1 MAG: Holliday junction ATP-dependent DNA helicase RuvA [Microgenomates group bacterium GW2011_GWA1_46_7]KKU45594.1 MAG: Holliday junction ATP-depend
MIAYLSGTLLTHTAGGAIIEVGGVGYDVIGLWLGRQTVGSKLSLYLYHYLENQSIPRLIGCPSAEARSLLLELISVNGVGPKMAGKILDSASVPALKTAITSADLDFLTTIKGLGKKTAQKIILDLGKTLVDSQSSAHGYIYEALRELSFEKREIDRAIEHSDLTGKTESEALGIILKALGRTS